jgi:hypothetical protein
MVTVPPPWAARRRLLSAAIAVLLLLGGPAHGEDPELARFLLEGGKKALEKKQYGDAIVKLARARVEDPGLVEVGYWIALAHDRMGATADAVREYRAFCEAYRSALVERTLDKGTEVLAKKAEARLAALAAGGTELTRLNASFVASMLDFAKTQYLRDPTLARRATEAVLAVAPGHEEALRLLERLRADLGGKPDPATPPRANVPDAAPVRPGSEFADIKRWKDLLETRGFGVYDGWLYDKKGLTIDRAQGGAFYWPIQAIRTGSRYVLEMEVRLTRVDNPRWGVGFGFAKDRQADHLGLFFSRSEVVSLQFQVGRPTAFAKPANIEPVEIDAWHRFAVDVDGVRVKAWFDDRVVLDATIPDGKSFAGEVGFYHQGNRCEVRSLRLGTEE